jgi:hypothetical protein
MKDEHRTTNGQTCLYCGRELDFPYCTGIGARETIERILAAQEAEA